MHMPSCPNQEGVCIAPGRMMSLAWIGVGAQLASSSRRGMVQRRSQLLEGAGLHALCLPVDLSS
eukprot:7305958-Pyramimonas_sp.AAC.1